MLAGKLLQMFTLSTKDTYSWIKQQAWQYLQLGKKGWAGLETDKCSPFQPTSSLIKRQPVECLEERCIQCIMHVVCTLLWFVMVEYSVILPIFFRIPSLTYIGKAASSCWESILPICGCQNQVSRLGMSNWIPLYLWCDYCPWYLLRNKGPHIAGGINHMNVIWYEREGVITAAINHMNVI